MKTDLNFCYLIHNEKNLRNLPKQIEKAYKINKNFWKITLPKFRVRLVYTRKEMDKEWGEKTPKWLSGFVWKGKLVFLKRLKINQDNLIHEMNHLFYQHIIKTYKPFWIQEGLALNIEKSYKIKKINKINQKYLYYTLNKEYYKNSKEFYETSYLVVKKLLRNLGKEKLFRLLKKYSKKPTKNNYEKIFGGYLKVYPKRFKEKVLKELKSEP